MKIQTGQHVRPARRRWRPIAIASAAAVVLAGGLATANAATSSSSGQASVLSTSSVDEVVQAADTFLDTLTDDQQDEVLLDFSDTNVADWSNLACGSTCRPGIAFSSLSDTQLAAAKAVLSASMGTGDNVGYQQATQIQQADDYLSQNTGSGQNSGATTTPSASAPAQPSSGASARPSGSAPAGQADSDASTGVTTKSDLSSSSAGSSSNGPGGSSSTSGGSSSSGPGGSASSGPGGSTPSGFPSGRPSGSPSRSSGSSSSSNNDEYGSGNYYLAFLGTPSTSGDWQLHFGGDNLAINLTYADGGVISASPYYAGVEPTSFTSDGTTYAPLDAMRTAMHDLTASLSETEADEAHGTDAVDDVVLGPGEDGQFPSSKAGLAVSGLSDDQQALVLAAIEQWVQVADDDTADALLAEYKADLDETYIQYAGSPDLDAAGDYVRIDGPGVWIEFLCRTGTADPEQLSYQSIYRDHDRDYGGSFTF